MQPVAISADSPEEVGNMCRKAGISFPVLSDRSRKAIQKYDLMIEEKGDDGREIGGPGEFLIDPSGTIRWRKLTELHPPEIASVAKLLQ